MHNNLVNSNQAAGQLRELLTALGAVLIAWGVNDGHDFVPVIGVAVTAFSVTWGVVHHKDPNNPGSLSWSLVRKLFNAVGAALVTYGLLAEEKFLPLDPMLAALGPVLALYFSYFSNSKDDEFGGPSGLASLVALLPFFTLGCASQPQMRFTPDGCAMVAYQVPEYKGVVWAGICGEKTYVVEWEAPQVDGKNVAVRARRVPSGVVTFEYRTDEGWLLWSSKSGINVGAIPSVDLGQSINTLQVKSTLEVTQPDEIQKAAAATWQELDQSK